MRVTVNESKPEPLRFEGIPKGRLFRTIGTGVRNVYLRTSEGAFCFDNDVFYPAISWTNAPSYELLPLGTSLTITV